MEVILIDDVFQLGKRGDVVHVADGYGRNYLIPKNLAVPATAANRKMVDQQKVVLARKEAKLRGEAEILAEELNRLHLITSRKAGETGALFGSVTAKDVSGLLEGRGIHVDRRKILIEHPIKNIGNFTVEVRLHSEVGAQLLLSVLMEGDEQVARVKERDKESEALVAELDARVKELQKVAPREAHPEPPEAPAPTEPQA